MKPVLHRVRLVTPPERPEDGEWPDWVVALSCVGLLVFSAITLTIILLVAVRALGRLLHVG